MSEIERSEAAVSRYIGYALVASVGLSAAIVMLVIALGMATGVQR